MDDRFAEAVDWVLINEDNDFLRNEKIDPPRTFDLILDVWPLSYGELMEIMQDRLKQMNQIMVRLK